MEKQSEIVNHRKVVNPLPPVGVAPEKAGSVNDQVGNIWGKNTGGGDNSPSVFKKFVYFSVRQSPSSASRITSTIAPNRPQNHDFEEGVEFSLNDQGCPQARHAKTLPPYVPTV